MRSNQFINPFPDKDGEICLLACGYGTPQTGLRAGPWIVPMHIVHYIVQGKGWYERGGVKHRVHAGDVFVSMPGDLVSYYAEPGESWSYCWVQVTGRLVQQCFETIGVDDEHVVFHQTNHTFMDSVVGVIQYVDGKENRYSQMRLNAFVLEALSGLDESASFPSSGADKRERYVQAAISFMEYHSDETLRVADIAYHLGLERSYFYRIFKEVTGCSPQEYLLKLRIDKAKMLLATGISPANTAAALGFADIYYFSKVFKRAVGATPAQYMANHRLHAKKGV